MLFIGLPLNIMRTIALSSQCLLSLNSKLPAISDEPPFGFVERTPTCLLSSSVFVMLSCQLISLIICQIHYLIVSSRSYRVYDNMVLCYPEELVLDLSDEDISDEHPLPFFSHSSASTCLPLFILAQCWPPVRTYHPMGFEDPCRCGTEANLNGSCPKDSHNCCVF